MFSMCSRLLQGGFRWALMHAACRGPQIKSSLISTGFFTDSLPTHVVAGLGAGFLAVCVGSPVDVVKSRMMGARPARASGSTPGESSLLLSMLQPGRVRASFYSPCTGLTLLQE